MSVVPPLHRGSRPFGSGGAEPYAAALRGSGRALRLLGGDGSAAAMDFGRWSRTADPADRLALRGLDGPVLDVGCGPGRMVRAALEAGLPALGVDVAAAAVARCHADGLPVLRRSVFAPLPREGRWAAVLLLDGNVGIGGAVDALLARCAALLRPGGALVVEVHDAPVRDAAFQAVLTDDAGGRSAAFPWAEVGAVALGVHAARTGLEQDAVWTADGRAFVRLRRP